MAETLEAKEQSPSMFAAFPPSSAGEGTLVSVLPCWCDRDGGRKTVLEVCWDGSGNRLERWARRRLWVGVGVIN